MPFDYAKITNMHTHMLAEKMKRQWQQNSKNFAASIGAGGARKPPKTDEMAMAQPAESGTDMYLVQIKAKMQSGQALSAVELDYLREKYPEVYKAAMDTAREREMYKEKLRESETKEQARMQHLGQLASDYSQVQEAKARGDISTALRICGKINGLSAVFREFAASDEFENLPDDARELEEIREEESVLPEAVPEEEKTEETEEEEKAEEIKEPETAGTETPEDVPGEGASAPEEGKDAKPAGAPAKTASPGKPEPSKASRPPAAAEPPRPERPAARAYSAGRYETSAREDRESGKTRRYSRRI